MTDEPPNEPAIVLVEPQLGFNIGACARAMLNCGLRDLRLVRPRDGWPNPSARSAATGAVEVVDEARVFDSTAEAVADLQLVYATTGRHRDIEKPVFGPTAAVEEMREAARGGTRFGVLFGPERTGLENDDLVLATRILSFPLDPALRSLNLAQAVLLVCWEWRRAGLDERELLGDPAPAAAAPPAAEESTTAPPVRRRRLERRGPALQEPATQHELVQFHEHLEQELDASGFFRVPEKREGMILNLRAFFSRAVPTRQEVRTLHGVVTALSGRRKDGRPHRIPGSRQEESEES